MLKHTVKTCAKINLMLDCLGKREDGYHNLDMIMQTVDLWDRVTVELNDSGVITCKGMDIPNEDNIMVKSAKEFLKFAGKENFGVDIEIEKHIPMCGGLGGGSADAAAVLRILDEMIGDKDMYMLSMIAQNIGSDVPFALFGGTLHAEGRGEILTPVPLLPKCWFVVTLCGEKESTGKAFATLDTMENPPHPKVDGFISALETNDIKQIAPLCENSFSVMYDYNEIEKTMKENGAMGVCLSGAGPAVYGIFRNKFKAESCAEKFKEAYVCQNTDASIFFE